MGINNKQNKCFISPDEEEANWNQALGIRFTETHGRVKIIKHLPDNMCLVMKVHWNNKPLFDGQILTPCLDDQLRDGFMMLRNSERVTYWEMIEPSDKQKPSFIPGSITPQPYRTHKAITNSIRNILVFRNGQIELKFKEDIKYG